MKSVYTTLIPDIDTTFHDFAHIIINKVCIQRFLTFLLANAWPHIENVSVYRYFEVCWSWSSESDDHDQQTVADPGFVNGGGPGNRRETRGGSREGCTPPWVRGPGRSPGSCRFCRSPHMSFKEYSESKQGFHL